MSTHLPYPKWSELPELDLYLDQVLLYVNQFHQEHDKKLTASMINNYVKHGHLEKPIKKKYNRHQIARLIVITSLKAVFAIQEITQTLLVLKSHTNIDIVEAYNNFVSCMNGENVEAVSPIISSACQTLQLYYQTYQLAIKLEGDNH